MLEYIRNGFIISLFVFFGYLIIKSVFKETEDKEKIKKLGKKLLKKERVFSEIFKKSAKEKEDKLYKFASLSGEKDKKIV